LIVSAPKPISVEKLASYLPVGLNPIAPSLRTRLPVIAQARQVAPRTRGATRLADAPAWPGAVDDYFSRDPR
jgi:hypothetical protein